MDFTLKHQMDKRLQNLHLRGESSWQSLGPRPCHLVSLLLWVQPLRSSPLQRRRCEDCTRRVSTPRLHLAPGLWECRV